VDEVLGPAARSLFFAASAVAIAAVPGLPLAAALGLTRARWGRPALVAARIAMAFPTVVVGLVVYGLLSRHGPLGPLYALYTPYAIVLGEVMLALPLIVALGAASIRSLDPRFIDTVRALRFARPRVVWLAVREAREGVIAAVLAAFARCVTELGVALLVGGNLVGGGFFGGTRTLTTAIATETSRGDFPKGLWLGLVLVSVAVAVNVAVEAFLRPRTSR
jgi:tungstate transport system permease protein